jgi:putative membrane protein
MAIRNFRDHAANERTFLAWVRTALAVVAFGFLVARFDLFLSYLRRAMPHGGGHALAAAPGFAVGNLAGITLIVLGMLMIAVAIYRFTKTARDIEKPDIVADSGDQIDVTFAVLLILLSGGLLFYLAEMLAQNA